MDTQFSEQTKLIQQLQHTVQETNLKLNSVSEVSSMQQQLLTQKDIQIQQVKDAHYTQQGLYHALQLQLQNSNSGNSGSSKENNGGNNSSQMSEQGKYSLLLCLLL